MDLRLRLLSGLFVILAWPLAAGVAIIGLCLWVVGLLVFSPAIWTMPSGRQEEVGRSLDGQGMGSRGR